MQLKPMEINPEVSARCCPGWGSPASGASWTCWGWKRSLWARCQRLPARCCCCFPSRPSMRTSGKSRLKS
ncbi:UCHL1 isoform 1 [Pan troglodytes]|uniref:Ubiquitin C-terminal hydrolase L1 n=3 Tax=Hominidae TaxID=9604 RepID=D6RJD9_HUMAN|nr:ubiquitin C-terminal hydrolase L1 [Homo sapiens]KAI4025268.1 ubiquitin C-terminal hydrolase L1 [Homo sapiens]PNI83162.1 UCHL1 isoform 1 [Pan troglodytes]PNJ30916.1 UCHL1 isoform 5 [Pongo abelii]